MKGGLDSLVTLGLTVDHLRLGLRGLTLLHQIEGEVGILSKVRTGPRTQSGKTVGPIVLFRLAVFRHERIHLLFDVPESIEDST